MKGLYQKKNSEYWYYQPPTPKGEKRPKAMALGTTSEVEAINSVTDMQWSGRILAAEAKHTLADLLPRYYAAKSEDRKKTRQGREQILDAFKDRIGNPKITDISRQTILDWRIMLATTGGTTESTKPVTETTMTSYLIAVRAFLKWCVEEKLIRKNPAVDLGKQSTVRVTRRMDFFTLEQRELLLARPCLPHIGLILHLGFFAGLRIGEMLVMNKSWLYIADDWSHGSIRVQDTVIQLDQGAVDGKQLTSNWTWKPKTKRGVRTIPLHPRLLAFLQKYGIREPYLLAPHRPLFPPDEKTSLRFDPKRALRSHGKVCGVTGVCYHKLRHSLGTHLAMGGAAMAEIAGLLGNTVKVCEESYAGYSPRTNNPLPGV